MGNDAIVEVRGDFTYDHLNSIQDWLLGAEQFDFSDDGIRWTSPRRYSDADRPHLSWPTTRSVITTLRLVTNLPVWYGDQYSGKTHVISDKEMRKIDREWWDWYGKDDA